MAEFKLERFKYRWRGEWSAGNDYLRDDIVRVNGKSYVCLLTHSSNPDFRTDLNAVLPGSNPPQPQPKWTVMTDGRQFLGSWETGNAYNLGDIVLYDGTMWLCTTSHTSTSFAAGASNWETFVKGIKFASAWQPATDYGHGAIVKYNGVAYKCLVAHSSQVTLEDNASDWETFFDGIQYVSDWTPITTYRLNDLVRYGPTIFRCTETHTSGELELDITKFEVELPGSQNNGEWDSETYYNQGDIVRYGGYLYFAVQNNFDLQPSLLDSSDSSASWIILAKTNNIVGDWRVDAFYKTGDIVLRGGQLFLAKIDVGGPDFDGSTADYLDPGVWELIAPGQAWKLSWNVGNYYSVGDIVYHLGSAYVCNFEHIAEYSNGPGDNGSGYVFWDLLIQAGLVGGLHDPGDLLTYGLNREVLGDGSSLGDARVPIGTPGEILSVSEDLEVFWRTFINDADVVYVAPNGKDARGYGLTSNRPFRSVRYACEYVEDNYPLGSLTKISVATGRYEELNPMSIPAGCVVMGDELRATTIACTSARPDYQNDFQFVQEYFTRLNQILLPILNNQTVTPTVGNVEPQITTGPIAGQDSLIAINGLIEDYTNYILARIDDAFDGTDPENSGTNTPSNLYANAAAQLLLNQNFIVEEIIAWMNLNYGALGKTREKLSQDVNGLIRGIRKDLIYIGNHFTLLAARRYANGVNGGFNDDLFYVRDTTGLRDCTVEGLRGGLNPPGVFELYQRPTGGACVSLDPGWGPDDERTWIVNRSPYIQGVTNIGTACVGMKVDGNLHNGGNKSMTANDFTQVLSDGIGAWVTNNARAELVSVFTYYNQVGYLAENGGVIRATNGNNSYGNFGSIAQGNDPTEEPQEVLVNNRVNEAEVFAGFAGGNDDRIFVFEYNNCGEEYTQASAEIIGSGSNAEFEYTDFRQKALYEARLINTTGSGAEGGSGYLIRQGFAQETADSRHLIKLSATDITQDEAEIINMRLSIISGDGTGQYGQILSHNIVTRDTLIAQESFGTINVLSTTAPSTIELENVSRLKVGDAISFAGNVTGTLIAEKTKYFITAVSAFDNTIEITDVEGDPAITSILTVASLTDVVINKLGWDHVIPGYPLNTSFNSTAQYRIEPRLTTTKPPFTASTANFVSERNLKAITFGGTSFTYTNLSNEFGSADIEFEDLDREEAVFRIVREGTNYTVILTDGGVGYAIGDTITINGQRLGGNTPINDVIITVTETTEDSSNSIVDFTFTGTPRAGRFIAIADPNYVYVSDNGENWSEIIIPTEADWRSIISGDNRFVAVAYNDNRINFSYDGDNWTTRSLPNTNNWIDGAYGAGKFVIIAEGSNEVLYSETGLTFTSTSIPDYLGGDSTASQWQKVVYGQGKFVAISGSDRMVATSVDGVVWTRHELALPNDNYDFAALEYGNNRFLAITTDGKTVYSVNGGTVWYQGDDLPNDGLDAYTWTDMSYSQGVFLAISKSSAGNSNNVAATTEDGIAWTERATANSQRWSVVQYATVNQEPLWIALSDQTANSGICVMQAGAQAKVRANVFQGKFESIKIIDPGSNYDEFNDVEITVSDNSFVTEIELEYRKGNGVLAQPDFINRGSGYRTSTSQINVTGDGYADIIPEESTLTLSGVEVVPGPGVQIRIEGILDDTTADPDDLKLFTGITIQDLGDDGSGNGTRNVRFTVSPRMRNEYNLAHATNVTLRSRYSQCRITGHDFLDIGTGNFEETNDPEIYADGNYFLAAPENEVLEVLGGRVFYVSTDQDGNFRGGELFSVEQATGIVTISAEFFELDGLSELALGGVRLGGSGTVVREFSTDPTFSEDSNNVVPTQRAIATFLANRLSVGGENLEVNSILAGRVQVGTFENKIFSPAEQYVYFNAPVNITGGLDGQFLAQALFLRGQDD
jgi:hypothetical protein